LCNPFAIVRPHRMCRRVAGLSVAQEFPLAQGPRAIPPPSWTLCPIEGPSVPAVPQAARALTRPAIRSRSIVPLAGHVSVYIRHWHTICLLPEMSGACAYEVYEMADELRVRPGLEGGISPCGVSVFTAAAARG
jgi:hypothetical protein